MIHFETVRNEPFGHLVPETKLERYWAQSSGLASLRRRRAVRFDPHACATYAPVTYVSTATTLRTDLPDEDWIRASLKNFIRVEFSERRTKLSPPDFTPKGIEEIDVSDALLDMLVRQVGVEVEEIVGNLLEGSDVGNPEEMAKKIFQLLCHPKVGIKSNQTNFEEAEFIRRVAPAISSQERLLFILLGFPFKDQNRFRVQDGSDQPDMGEIAFLVRLYRATQAIYQIHPYGADILVLTDGEIYQNIFGVTRGSVTSYAEKLKSYRSKLNLQGAVSFIPLSDLIERASCNPIGLIGADTVTRHLREKIAGLFNNDESIRHYAHILVSAIKWNHESHKLLGALSPEDAWSVLTLERDGIRSQLHNQWLELHEKAISSAIDYAATNLMLRWLDLVNLYFPDAIRCTIHAKPGQICLARANAAFPWNGVAWTDEWPTSIDDFEVKPFYSLSEMGPVRKIKIRALGTPYFFTKATYGSNINAAKNVLSADGWSVEDVSGRPFTRHDLMELLELGRGDDNFSWERLIRDEEYYRKILSFRIDHYEQYGFGVHGVWMNGSLVGQCGLQVLNETRDQVELVIFLGKAYVRKGIGLKLTRYILDRCHDTGVRAVYGVVRPENVSALDLLRRVNAKPIRTQVHFGYIATVFEIPLRRS